MQTNLVRSNTTPARLSFPADFLPIDADDPLGHFRRNDVFDCSARAAEYTDAKKGVAVRAEVYGSRYRLLIAGKTRRTVRAVFLKKRKNGNLFLWPPIPPRWRSAGLAAIQMIREGK